MKKSSKSSLEKRSLDISLQHKNQASYNFSKTKFCTWPKTGLALKELSTMCNGGHMVTQVSVSVIPGMRESVTKRNICFIFYEFFLRRSKQ